MPLDDGDREEDEELKRNDGAEFFFLWFRSMIDNVVSHRLMNMLCTFFTS